MPGTEPAPARRRPSPADGAVVALGGAAGTVLRAWVEQRWPAAHDGFPWPTFAVNLAGAAVLGLVVALVAERRAVTRTGVRLLVGTGFCGGLTTFSTWMVEVDLLVRAGRAGLAVGYAAASLAAGLVAVAAGLGVGRLALRRPEPVPGEPP